MSSKTIIHDSNKGRKLVYVVRYVIVKVEFQDRKKSKRYVTWQKIKPHSALFFRRRVSFDKDYDFLYILTVFDK